MAADPGSKSARTRQRILDAAAHVLSRKGYTGTRLADVARAAEVAAPANIAAGSSRRVNQRLTVLRFFILAAPGVED